MPGIGGFNGARPWRPGRAHCPHQPPALRRRASTGPGLGGREGLPVVAVAVDGCGALQRGPALEAGKGPPAWPSGCRRSRRFNGARPWRPGRVQPAALATDGQLASTGPGLGGREGFPGCRIDHAARVLASTGPGLGGREGQRLRSWHQVRPVLQRGPALEAGKGVGGAERERRGLGPASTGPGLGGREGTTHGGTRSTTSSFNGARPWRPGRVHPARRGPAHHDASTGPGLGGREGEGGRARLRPLHVASTGPGLGGREGLNEACAICGQAFTASTGPGLGGREGATRASASVAPSPSFNGARPWRPGRAAPSAQPRARPTALQRGPALEAGKGHTQQDRPRLASALQRGPALEAGKGAEALGRWLGGEDWLQRGPALEAGKGRLGG